MSFFCLKYVNFDIKIKNKFFFEKWYTKTELGRPIYMIGYFNLKKQEEIMRNRNVFLTDETVKKLMQSAYYMAYKILKNEADAEDIASEVMLTVVEKADQLKDEKAFEAWANRIVVNKCYDYIKKMKPVLCGDYGTEFIDGAKLEEYNVEFLPEEFAVNEEKRRLLMEVIKEETNEVEMTTIMHFYYNDESISYIAENMDCAEITVKKRLASARKKIKDGIEKRLGKGAVLMAVGITVLGKAMRVEASETKVPETLMKFNGGLEMSKLAGTKAGLSGGAIAGICGGAVAGIAAIVAGIMIATGGGKSGKTDTVVTNPTTIESEQETTETPTEAPTVETTTTKAEDVVVPVEFERYEVDGIDFVPPSVYEKGDTQCKFFWEHTEENFINWFQENIDTTDKYQYNVYNSWEDETMNARERIFTVKAVNGEDNAKIDITSNFYNKDVPCTIIFEYSGAELENTVDAAKKFVEYMGLKEYEEEILHATNSIRLKPENGIGEYVITSYYYFTSLDKYEMRISVWYSDSNFMSDDEVNNTKPANFETYDENHKLPELLSITKFDVSSLDAFCADLHNCIKENINDTIEFNRMKRNIYSYTYDSENEEKICAEVNNGFVCDSVIYNRNGKDKKGEYMYHFYSDTDDEGKKGFTFMIGVLPIFDELKYEGVETEADIKLICDARYKVLKEIVPSINISEEDFLKLYTEGTTFEQEIDEQNIYCKIWMDFDTFSVSIYQM